MSYAGIDPDRSYPSTFDSFEAAVSWRNQAPDRRAIYHATEGRHGVILGEEIR